MSIHKVAAFVCLDDFAQIYESFQEHHLLPRQGQRRRSGKLSLGEMLFIMVLFHSSGYKWFKLFYLQGICGQYRDLFREVPSYGRFVTLMPRLFLPLCALLHHLSGERTGLYIADSTHLGMCHPRRIHRHKVFAGLAKRGKTTMGWFFGFKLHIVINHKGEIVAVKITQGNVDDRSMLDAMTQGLQGKMLADKGYISQKLFRSLWNRGLHLITGIRKNMRNHLMPFIDKILLRKRFIIETVFDNLKSHMGIHHTRHRSPANAFVHILSCIVAYQLKDKKPNIKNMP